MALKKTLTFPGLTLKGIFGPVMDDVPDVQLKRTKFAGVRGESILHLGLAGRDLRINCYLFDNFTSHGSIVRYLDGLAKQTGLAYGTLTIPSDGGIARSFHQCLFMGFEKQSPGILPDVNGMLEGGGTYFVMGNLLFRQTEI